MGMPLTLASSWVPQPTDRYMTVAVIPADCPVTVSHWPPARSTSSALAVGGAGLEPRRRPPNTPAAMISAAATARLALHQRRRRGAPPSGPARWRAAHVAARRSAAARPAASAPPWGGSSAASAMASSADTRASRAGSAGQPGELVPAVPAGGQVLVHQRALGRVDGAKHVDAERQPRLRAVHRPVELRCRPSDSVMAPVPVPEEPASAPSARSTYATSRFPPVFPGWPPPRRPSSLGSRSRR